MTKTRDPTAGMTEAQKAYEAKRAAKAGMSLEKWLAQKEKSTREATQRKPKAVQPRPKAKRRGMLRRVLDLARGER